MRFEVKTDLNQNWYPLLWFGNDPQARHDDRALDANKGFLHICQRLDDAPGMSGGMSRVAAEPVTSKCQAEAQITRGFPSKVRQDQRRFADHQARNRKRC